MLEIGLMVAIFASAAVAIGRMRRHEQATSDVWYDEPVDLPCPWCRAQTREDDTACPSCLQPFVER